MSRTILEKIKHNDPVESLNRHTVYGIAVAVAVVMLWGSGALRPTDRWIPYGIVGYLLLLISGNFSSNYFVRNFAQLLAIATVVGVIAVAIISFILYSGIE